VNRSESYIDELVLEGAERLLARAQDTRSLDSNTLVGRIRKVLDKYLLKDDKSASASAIGSFIDDLQADDLCLVLACESGDQLAWDDLVQRFSVTVKSAARSASANEDAAEELAQSIWAELYGLRARSDGQPATKLAYYSGRGSLAGWLRAVVAQLAIDQHRKQARLIQPEEDAEMERFARSDAKRHDAPTSLGTVNPEEAISDKLAGEEISGALEQAISELDADDRLLVKLYYFDELRLREAGAVLGVHEATASRRLSRVHSDLRNRVQRILVEQHGWTRAEADRSFAEVAVNLETDLEGLIAPQKIEEEARSGT
jgi:RNA polymerase sigma-70 factor (ECF subfamily)